MVTAEGTVGTAVGTAVTAEATGAEAATGTTADGTTADLVQAEVLTLTTDTDVAVRATDTVVDAGIEAVTTTAVEDVLVHAPHAVTEVISHAATAKGLVIDSALVRSVKEDAVRRLLPQKLQKTIATSVLFSSSKSPSVPRHAIYAPSSSPLDLLSKPRLSKIESLAARRGKLVAPIRYCSC